MVRQQAHPPEPEQLRRYLHDTWTLNLDDLEMEAMSIPWFREGGHQSRFAAPKAGLATTNSINPQGRKVKGTAERCKQRKASLANS